MGDVIGFVHGNGTIVAKYEYDAWGNCEITQDTTSAKIATLNPIRYRGYYWDSETGFYYLQSRYYDPAIGRFLNIDDPVVLKESPMVLTDKNLFAYCDNNPVTRTDDDGEFWETAFDIVSLGISIVDVAKNPSDPWAWAGLVGDAVDLVPFVTGAGEIVKSIKVAKKAAEAVDDLHDAAKVADATSEIIEKTPVIGKMADLNNYNLASNEFKVADLLPDKGSPRLNWKQNSSVLRKFADGRPIRDVSPYPMKNAGFLGAERNLLENRGYEYMCGFWIKKR